MSGYIGKVLRVDLTAGRMEIETLPEPVYRKYLGGRGLVAYYLAKLTDGGTKPFDGETPLIFATGVLTGSMVAGSGRHAVGTLSPLTGGFTSSEAGGYWGTYLKKAGFDAVVLTGQAKSLTYLYIDDDGVRLEDAESWRGSSTVDFQKAMYAVHGNKCHVAQCGPAGERRIPYACVVHDLRHFAGRGGIGAVMGSKQLRGIVVSSSQNIPLHDKAAVLDINKRNIKAVQQANGLLTELGTAGIIRGMNEGGGFPTFNFKEGQFSGAEALTGEAMREKYIAKHESCAFCPVRCKPVVKVEGALPVTGETGGPEYESIASFGPMCGVEDLAAVCYANDYCNRQGLDTISAGNVIAFAMECYAKGLIPERLLEGMKLRFGNAGDMVAALEAIASQTGFGRIMGQGVAACSELLGPETAAFACHVKGQEMAYHEPRTKYGCGLGYAVSPTGADHQHTMNDLNYVSGPNELIYFGLYEPEDPYCLSAKKVAMFIEASGWRHILDSLVICHFMPWTPQQTTEIINGVTGWDMTSVELVQAGRRILALTRIINARYGFTEADDRLPKRFSEAFAGGPVKGNRIRPEEMEEAVRIYYQLLNYDAHGRPTREIAALLGIGWAMESGGQPPV